MADFASVFQMANRPTVALEDPMQAYGKAMQMKTAMQQQELGGLQLQQQKQALADAQGFRDHVAAGGDPAAYYKRTGNMKAYHELTTAEKQAQEAEFGAIKGRIGATNELNNTQLTTLLAARDAIAKNPAAAQQVWAETRARLTTNAQPFAKALKLDLSRTDDPPEFPGMDFLEKKIGQNMDHKARLEEGKAKADAEYKAWQQKHGDTTAAEGARHNKALEGQGYARLALDREKAAKEKAEKPLTESQGNALGFGLRARSADAIMSELEKTGVNVASVKNRTAGALPVVGNYFKTPDIQKVEQAQRNFVTAVLRKESGAAISAGEFDTEATKYFPQLGDSDEVKTQKREARQLAIEALQIQAGRPLPSSVPPVQPEAQRTPPAAAPVSYKGEKMPRAKYNAMSREAQIAFTNLGGMTE